jgi:signal transduction histidine kinase
MAALFPRRGAGDVWNSKRAVAIVQDVRFRPCLHARSLATSAFHSAALCRDPADVHGSHGQRDEIDMDDDQLHSMIELIRRVRHDANGPLTVVLGHIQLLLEADAPVDDDVRRSLEVVDAELRRLIATLRRLDEVRLDAGPDAAHDSTRSPP